MWILASELPSDCVWNMLCCNAPPLCVLGGSLPSVTVANNLSRAAYERAWFWLKVPKESP